MSGLRARRREDVVAAPSVVVVVVTVPSAGGSRVTAASSEAGSTGGRSDRERRVDADALADRARSRRGRRSPGPGSGRRTGPGVVSGRPVWARAPGWTVIVWYVPAPQCVVGRIVRVVCVAIPGKSRPASRARPSIADATEAGAIGVLNAIVIGASTARSVAIVARNAAWVSGTISVGSVAVVVAGRTRAMTPRPRKVPRPRATPTARSPSAATQCSRTRWRGPGSRGGRRGTSAIVFPAVCSAGTAVVGGPR